MFHAPSSETKQQNDSTRTQSPRADFSAPVLVAAGSVPLRGQLARLHSTYGNQAVLRMLSHPVPPIQTKLAVNKPGDEFEQEADRVADQVMRMTEPAPSIQRKCSGCEEEEKIQRKCAECEEEEKQTGLQRKETGADPQFAPPVVHDVLRSSGQPLDPGTRAFMEPRFGHDFSAVRVHTDASAADSARAVNALAYTAGQHVVFGSNRYSPGTHQGQRLLAHELAHVVQSKPHLARDKAEQPAPTPNPVPNPPTNQPTAAPAPAANPPATCTVPADAAKQIADQGIPAKVIASMKYAIGMGTIRAGKAIALTDAIINQADAAIKAQFGSLLPSRSFSKGGSITKQTPDQIANARVPDAETARRIIRQLALRTSEDALKALCITDEDNSVLDSAVAVPVLATLTIDGVRNYEKSEIGGVTSFPTQAGALPKVTLPTESPNIGHIVVHEAMHFYVHDVYRNTAEAGQFRREMMEGGAEFMARLVIMNQLSSDPNFVINYSTYSNEVNFIYKNYTMGGNFPLAYLQGRVDVLGLKPVQPKKEIDQSGDPLEREADHMADKVMRMTDPSIQRKCSACAEEEKVQRKCAGCEEEEKKTGLQRKESSAGPHFAPPSVHRVLSLPGHALDPATRAFMEPRFGYDFSGVRVHTGQQASDSARDVNAMAYTVGRNIVFGAGKYTPQSDAGRQLLAHELAHVVQQDTATVRRQPTTAPMTRAEFEQTLRNRYGVIDIHTGTREEQAGLRNVPPDALLNWQSWDPGTSSTDYAQILHAFENFAATFGGTPNVRTVIFFRTEYEVNQTTHTAQEATNVGASFAWGTLKIFQAFSQTSTIPTARSNTSGTYPPVGGQIVEEGALPGAPLPPPTREQNIERNIMHELGHGLAEAVMGTLPDRGLDPSLMREYAWAVGWATPSLIGFTSRGLYDIGVPAVQNAFNNALMPPAQYHILPTNWNSPQWVEQPISHYMVEVSEGEDFAEAVRVFIESPDLLRQRSPHRYNFLQQHQTAWRSRLLRPHAQTAGSGIGTGTYLVVDDPVNDPLKFHRLTATEPFEGSGQIVEVRHDSDGYYYMWQGRRIQLPSAP